jgi:hypothetical protein
MEELVTLLGYTTSTSYDFTTNGVALSDDDNIAQCLDNLNEYLNALNTPDVNGSGSDVIAVNDTGSNFTATDLTNVLIELNTKAEASQEDKKQYETTSPIAASTNFTLPFSMTATVDATHSQYLDVILNGQVLFGGTIANGDDFEQTSTTTIQFRKTVPTGRNIIFTSRG